MMNLERKRRKMQNKIFSTIGISMKAGKLVSGESMVEQAVRDGKAVLVIVAEDASANTKKLFSDKCKFYDIPKYEYGTKEELGRAIGKEFRASIAIVDAGLAKNIEQELKNMNI